MYLEWPWNFPFPCSPLSWPSKLVFRTYFHRNLLTEANSDALYWAHSVNSSEYAPCHNAARCNLGLNKPKDADQRTPCLMVRILLVIDYPTGKVIYFHPKSFKLQYSLIGYVIIQPIQKTWVWQRPICLVFPAVISIKKKKRKIVLHTLNHTDNQFSLIKWMYHREEFLLRWE